MILVLSPAKSLDFQTPPPFETVTQPVFIDAAAELMGALRVLSPAHIASLLKISDPLAHLNVQRYAEWSEHAHSNPRAVKQAALAFNGDVYAGLEARSLPADALMWAQSHLRILSGLYGVLRPLDAIQPYRLDMGTRLANACGPDLYAFWSERITGAFNAHFEQLKQNTVFRAARARNVLVNLASAEYFKSIQLDSLNAEVITPVFEDWKNGRYRIISFYAKRARGRMARAAILEQIEDAEQLKAFDGAGYLFEPQASDQTRWVFRRRCAEEDRECAAGQY